MIKFREISGFTAHRIREEVARCTAVARENTCHRYSGWVGDRREYFGVEVYCHAFGLLEAFDQQDDDVTDTIKHVCEPLFRHTYDDTLPRPWEERE